MRLLILFAIIAVPSLCFGDAYKCRTPSGKVVISDSGCSGNEHLERVQSRENISLERQQQAHSVNSRNSAQLQRIEADDAAYRETIRQQQQAYAKAESQQTAINNQKVAADNLRRQKEDCSDLAARSTSRSQRAALSEICAKSEPDNKQFNDCKDQLARATSPSQRALIASNCTGDASAGARVRESSRPPPSPPGQANVASCDRGGCWDTSGNRYNSGAGGTMFRSDGKACTKNGSQFQCN